MVLRGDFDAARFEVLHRLIAAAMAEFQLERFAAKGLAEDLVAQTNPKNRDIGLDQVADGFDRVAQCRWIAGAIRKKNPGGLVPQRILSGSGGRQDAHAETPLPQAPQNVVFHSVIEGDDRNIRW